MPGFDGTKRPHRRFNPLTREWILVSPHRTQRPWQGQVETTTTPAGLKYDPACYMCPGNTRSTGHVNPRYKNVFVFDNDFPALLPEGEPAALNERDHSALRVRLPAAARENRCRRRKHSCTAD